MANMTEKITDNQRRVLLDWMRKIHQLEYAHRFESLKWSKKHKWIGISAFILSLIIAFSFRFPGVENSTYENLPFFFKQNFFVAFGATCVAVLSGLQTFLKPNEKAVLHQSTGSNYEKLRHRIELILNFEYSEWEFKRRTELIKEEWESLDAINVSEKNFLKGKSKVKSFKKYPEELSFIETI